jgi:hypothetical protein
MLIFPQKVFDPGQADLRSGDLVPAKMESGTWMADKTRRTGSKRAETRRTRSERNWRQGGGDGW